MLRDYFEDQLKTSKTITAEAERKITYKRVWSGKLITVGDRILYAYALIDDKEPRLFTLLERELDELDSLFSFVGMQDETVPVLQRK